MTRDEFEFLVSTEVEDWPKVGIPKVMAEYDRLTEINSQLFLACKAARRILTEDGVQDFEPIIIQLRAAIRAAEGVSCTQC